MKNLLVVKNVLVFYWTTSLGNFSWTTSLDEIYLMKFLIRIEKI